MYALTIAVLIAAFPPLQKGTVTLPDGTVTSIRYYDIAPPADPADDLTLTTIIFDQNRTAVLSKNGAGEWEGVVNLPKPLEILHPATGQKIQTTSLTYRLRKTDNGFFWNDKKTRSWTFEASVVPTGTLPTKRSWVGPDSAFQFSPFLYQRKSIGTIR